jgi:hypothetical protein
MSLLTKKLTQLTYCFPGILLPSCALALRCLIFKGLRDQAPSSRYKSPNNYNYYKNDFDFPLASRGLKAPLDAVIWQVFLIESLMHAILCYFGIECA